MFLGHYGIALAAKRAAPNTSLGTLFLAAQLLDELWPVLLLAGIERVRIVPGLTVLVISFLGSFAGAPPNERALAYGALAIWLFVPWAYWVDRHRIINRS